MLPVGSAVPKLDFSREWYLHNSDKVMLMAVLSFNFSSVIDIIYSIIRKAIITHFAMKKETVAEINDFLKGETIEIQFIYAFVLNIIFFILLFGAAMPILWISGFFSVMLIFWIYKLIFIKYCQKPLVFCHSINHFVTRLIFFGIVMSTIVSPLTFGGVIMPMSNVS